MLDNFIVGKQIAHLRKQNGLTQEELAEKLDISAQAISKWENGHSLPETMQLPVLAQIFGCSIDSILAPFAFQDSSFREFIHTIDTEYAELALQLYKKMKDKFSFTIDYKNEYYIFNQVFNGSCIIFNNPNGKDFYMRMDVEKKTSGKRNILVRLPLQNCSSYINIINNMSENIKKSFRCNDCTGCNLYNCPAVMAYTFEGVDYRQCHFIGVHLNSLETMEHIFTLLCAEHGL